MRLTIRAAIMALALSGVTPSAQAESKFNWDDLGAEFCRLTLANDMSGLLDLVTPELSSEIRRAASKTQIQPARTLFQSYSNEVPVCQASTRSAALVEIVRGVSGGAGPVWREYLVITPVADGTMRVDDVLFATRRSDTLRARLGALAR
jgi:hypothetical protein